MTNTSSRSRQPRSNYGWMGRPRRPDKNKKPAAPPKVTTDKPAAAKPGTEMIGMGQGRRPNHLEALEDVLAKSRDLNIHDTRRLMVWFKDVPDEQLAPPASELKVETNQPPAAKPGTVPASVPATPGAKPPAKPAAAGPPATAQRRDGLMPGLQPTDPDSKEPPRPIDLTARSVEAWVLRSESRSVLDKLRCKGATGQAEVHVVQEPAKPEDKGVDIKGDELNMIYHPDGSELVVTGDVASLLMDKIYILGPEVNIDQRLEQGLGQRRGRHADAKQHHVCRHQDREDRADDGPLGPVDALQRHLRGVSRGHPGRTGKCPPRLPVAPRPIRSANLAQARRQVNRQTCQGGTPGLRSQRAHRRGRDGGRQTGEVAGGSSANGSPRTP